MSVWEVGEPDLDTAVLRQHYESVLEGRVDAARRLRPGRPSASLEPSVVIRPEASDQATVLEVRAADGPAATWSARRSLASTSRCAQRTSTRSGRRRSTCSTSRRRTPECSPTNALRRLRTPYATRSPHPRDPDLTHVRSASPGDYAGGCL